MKAFFMTGGWGWWRVYFQPGMGKSSGACLESSHKSSPPCDLTQAWIISGALSELPSHLLVTLKVSSGVALFKKPTKALQKKTGLLPVCVWEFSLNTPLLPCPIYKQGRRWWEGLRESGEGNGKREKDHMQQLGGLPGWPNPWQLYSEVVPLQPVPPPSLLPSNNGAYSSHAMRLARVIATNWASPTNRKERTPFSSSSCIQ